VPALILSLVQLGLGLHMYNERRQEFVSYNKSLEKSMRKKHNTLVFIGKNESRE
jgi:hypothetical protein